MSYGLGRPAIIGEDATILNCRDFLKHILSVEILAIRGE
jgi:hypothetical protein